jgi:hypothetical protein
MAKLMALPPSNFDRLKSTTAERASPPSEKANCGANRFLSTEGHSTLWQVSRMSAKAARGAPVMPLRQLVDRYLALAGSFGIAVPLSSFGLTAPEIENLFSSYNEDYHISRFFCFSNSNGTAYNIDNEPATHISIDAGIRSIL